jgi:hypothetical protein
MTQLPKFINVLTIAISVKIQANISLLKLERYLETQKYQSKTDFGLYTTSHLVKEAFPLVN